MSNVDTARKLYQSINEDDPDAGAPQFAADAEWTEVPTGQTYRSPSGWHENYSFWKGAFPDGQVELTNVAAIRSLWSTRGAARTPGR
jgi:hypothetical protein